MSKSVVLAALILAAVLAGLALLVAGRERPVVVRGPILGIDPARVTEVRVERGDGGGAFESARRRKDDSQWEIVFAGANGIRSWPADPTRTRAMLRILSTLEFVRPAEPRDSVGPDATTVVIKMEGNASRTLRISPRSLAGQVLAAVGGRGAGGGDLVGWIGDEVREMLVTSGPAQWRDGSALSVGPEVSRISLRGQASSVSLGRVQGRWAIREPFQEPAEPDAVAKLTTALGAIAITDFFDGGAPGNEQTGLDHPAAVLRVETDVRDPDGGASRTVVQSVAAGRAVGIAGKNIYAAVSRDGLERIVAIAADSLTPINTEPTSYVAKRALPAAAADVGQVRVQTVSGAARVFTRTLDGWTVEASGAPSAAPPGDARAVEALLNLLTQTPAAAVIAGELKQPPAYLGEVSLSTLGGTAVAKLSLGAVDDGKARHLAVNDGTVVRVYGEPGDALVEWLAPGG